MNYIKARHYYLKNTFGYQLAIYSSKSKLLQSVDFSISNAEIEEIYQKNKEIIEKMTKSNQVMNDFWQHSTVEMKKALCLSYSNHKIKKNRKVSNVELSSNWTLEGFFADELKRFGSKNFLSRLLQLRTKGKHLRGIRFGYIHLVEDIVDSKPLFSVHWDNYYPKFFNFSAILHFLRDDIFS
jgi:hypothetical protein